MKLSRLLKIISDWFRPKPMASKDTHDAYCEQVLNEKEGTYVGRAYNYKTGELLEEYEGRGDRQTAGKHGKRILKKYKKGN